MCLQLLTAQAGGAPAPGPPGMQRKRSLERVHFEQRAAAAASPLPAGLERLTSAERRDILAGSPVGIPSSRRGSALATVPSEVGNCKSIGSRYPLP